MAEHRFATSRTWRWVIGPALVVLLLAAYVLVDRGMSVGGAIVYAVAFALLIYVVSPRIANWWTRRRTTGGA